MRLGAVLVHFHTPELAVAAVRSLREDAARSQLELEVVVVDNGSTAEGHRRLQGLGAEVLEPGSNLGYAGGVNLGARALDRPDVLVAMNPDLEILPGCLQALVEAVSGGVGVAGPCFYWDRPGGFMLPPAERRGRRESLRRFLASRSRKMAERALRAWRRHAREHWNAGEALPSHHLSGALLAITAEAWDRVGPFDEAYQLYFEETDWLTRAEALGIPGRYVPGAVCVHRYAQSTPKEPRAEGWFEASHRRYRRRHYGRPFTAALHAAANRWPQRSPRLPVPWSAETCDLEGLRWLEIAASPLGFPAAGRRFDEPVSRRDLLPEGLAPGRYFLRALGGGDRELWAALLDVTGPDVDGLEMEGSP